MIIKEKDKLIRTLVGVFFVFLLSWILHISPDPLQRMFTFLENGAYDFQIRHTFKRTPPTTPIVIIDIDDQSITTEGRWPWPRKKIAKLISQLFEMGSSVVAFDMIFPDSEQNETDALINTLSLDPTLKRAIEEKIGSANNDALLAQSLSQGIAVLGYAFKKSDETIGVLPKPILTLSDSLSDELTIPDLQGYLGNLEQLQSAAKYGGFINSSPDRDGILRVTPLILRHGKELYPSLALEATRLFLMDHKLELIVANYEDQKVLEGVRLEKTIIPTDPWGRVLIPFRGPPFTFPFISATSILSGKISPDLVKDKLVFIGSSATAMGDMVTTAISPVYTGVEIHADIASAIIEGSFPYKPAWGKGFSILLILTLGLLCAILLPQLGVVSSVLFSLSIPIILLAATRYMWVKYDVVLPIFFPLFALFILFVIDIIGGYVFEGRRRRELRTIFGHYVPSDYIDSMQDHGGEFALEGETKEISVLFADIRNFSTLSENMSANEIKKLLNLFFTPMTQVIFDQKGTIDKYVGDLVMAFWGAPLEDPRNAYNAVSAGLKMQIKLEELNRTLVTKGMPEIHIGIGINTGLMNVGDMGSAFRRSYTVIGDSVNLASRLELASKFYHTKIVVGEETYKKTADEFCYRKLDRAKLKGRGTAVDLYEPICFKNECTEEQKVVVSLEREAIDAYFKKNWEKSKQLFQNLQQTNRSSQKFYALYVERISQFQKNPPPENWDGTYQLELKI